MLDYTIFRSQKGCFYLKQSYPEELNTGQIHYSEPYLPVLCMFLLLLLLLSFVLFCFVGSTLTPLTPISVSDVNKSLLSNSISILGDNAQFQTGTVA